MLSSNLHALGLAWSRNFGRGRNLEVLDPGEKTDSWKEEPGISRNLTAARTRLPGLWNGRAARVASCLLAGEGQRAAAMLPYTVNFKVSARTLTGALNAHNKAAVDW